MECIGRSAKSSKQGAIPSRRYRYSHAGQRGRPRACPDRTRKLFGDTYTAHDRLQRAGAGSRFRGFLCSPKAIRSADLVRCHSRASVSLTNPLKTLERVKGIEPSSSAWKAVALPLSYTRIQKSEDRMQVSEQLPSISDPCSCHSVLRMVGEVGLEPTKAQPADLQSAPFAARDTPPF